MSTIAVRFLIDGARKRVVLAEAGCDFVDVLFSFLTLPLGTIVRLLGKESGLGSLDALYESVEKLDAKHLKTEACKELLLNPRSAAAVQCENMKIQGIHNLHPRKFLICDESECLTQSTSYYTYSPKGLCSRCGKLMGKGLEWVEDTSGEEGIFVNNGIYNFMITDDLRVIPASLQEGLSLFKEMGVKFPGILDQRVMKFGKEEILNLLRRSLVSNDVLTHACFPDTCVQGSLGFFLPVKDGSFDNEAGNEISLKLVLSKNNIYNNNNILYAEVGEDFVNLLFSFLTFPLGAVLRVVSENLSLGGCIKNLYSSAETLGLDCFKSEICRDMLLNPKLPTFYKCNENQTLQLEEITSRKLLVSKGCPKCYVDNGYKPCESSPCKHGINKSEIIEWNPKCAKIMTDAGEGFVVSSRKFMISDNLHVSPLSIIDAIGSRMSLLTSGFSCKEACFDNVKALGLLGAMLISKTVLSDVFSSKPTQRRKSL